MIVARHTLDDEEVIVNAQEGFAPREVAADPLLAHLQQFVPIEERVSRIQIHDYTMRCIRVIITYQVTPLTFPAFTYDPSDFKQNGGICLWSSTIFTSKPSMMVR
ncbi:jg8415 [Pararge aegeria aegeria]|uniref:Jg8415 protein n=1 Tax=Pararge aegeria aegeria TaxID=348720 RepID=A0A8S4SMS2_9NEOP|nr:jg8415 [Pararge aegeria aegeria]